MAKSQEIISLTYETKKALWEVSLGGLKEIKLGFKII